MILGNKEETLKNLNHYFTIFKIENVSFEF